MGAGQATADGCRTADRGPRDPHWDNVRFLSGMLVLIGHLIEPFGHLDGLRWLHITSWAMRVPVFVILSGYFSSAGPLRTRELRQLTESLLVPYLAIGLLHTAQMRFFHGAWTFYVTDPAWGLWFLLSLLLWRMMLPYLAVLRYPLWASGAAALAAGYLGGFGSEFSAARTLAFLPFFVLGRQLRQGLAERLLHPRWTGWAAGGVLAVTAGAGALWAGRIEPSWLAMSAPYAESVPLPAAWAWAVRGAVLVCGAAVALSFIRLVPRRRIPVLSSLGAGGLCLYLLHPLVLRWATLTWDLSGIGPWPQQIALIAGGVALAAALASPPVRRLARPLLQPRLPWLYARPQPAPPPPRPEGADATGRPAAAIPAGR